MSRESVVFNDNPFLDQEIDEDVKSKIEGDKDVKKQKVEVSDIETDDDDNVTPIVDSSKEDISKGHEDVGDIINSDDKPINSNSGLKSLLTKFGIDKYILQDDEGNDIENEINESDLDTDVVYDLLKDHFNYENESLKENYVSVDKMDSSRRELIDYIAKGGDPRNLIVHQEAINTVDRFDLDDESDAERVIREYKILKGDDDDEIATYVAGVKAQDKLTEVAKKAYKEIKSYHERQKEIEKETLQEYEIERKKKFKAYKKDLQQGLKDLGYTDKITSKVLDFATKPIEKEQNGNSIETFEMDEVYYGKRLDPEQAKDLALFLFDKESYLKKLLEGKEIEMKKDIMRKTNAARVLRSNSKSNTRSKYEENDSAIDAIPIN